jgi:hypothetical protein
MKKLPRLIPVVALVAMGIGSSHAEVATHVKANHTLGSIVDFSVTRSPCYVKAPGLNPDDVPQLRKLFTEAGMNVVADKSAPCQIMVDGYVTMPNGEGKPVTAVKAEWLLQNQDKVVEVGPALSASDAGADKAASDASGMGQVVSTADIEVVSRAGGMIGGNQGSIVATAIAALADVAMGIASRNKTKDGVAEIYAQTYYGEGLFKKAVASMKIFAASTTKENPATLIKAAVNRYVQELQLKEQEDKKKAMVETAAASASGGEGVGSAQ